MATLERRKDGPRVAFVYPNSREELAVEVEAGRAPDTTLLGQNHLQAHGIEARIHDPRLRPTGGPLARRVLWNLRELTVPWEVQAGEVVLTTLSGLMPLAARLRPGVQVVMLNYGGLATIWSRSGSVRRRLLRATLSAAARVICIGDRQLAQLAGQTRLQHNTFASVRLGVDERFFPAQPQASSDDPLVLAVGKDLARDYATFVEAVKKLGVRAEIACLPRNLDGVKLPPRVSARFVGPRELRELYREAACVVVPQRSASYPYGSEGGGLTALLEAMASARPVVASDRPILHDYVEEGKHALLVPPGNPGALCDAIARTLEDRDLAASLGAEGRARVEHELTTRHLAAGIAPILRAVQL